MEKTERNCFHCANFRLCCLRRTLDKVINEHLWLLAIDMESRVTGTYQGIYGSTASACTSYIFKEEK